MYFLFASTLSDTLHTFFQIPINNPGRLATLPLIRLTGLHKPEKALGSDGIWNPIQVWISVFTATATIHWFGGVQ